MAWVTLAEGDSLKEFQACQPAYSELRHGTKMLLTIESPWWAPIGPLADLFGAEWVADRLLNEGGAHVRDVEGKGWHKVVVHMEADPAWVIPLIWAIAALISSIAFLIAFIKLEGDIIPPIPPPVQWGILLLAAAAVIYVARRPAKPKARAPT